MRSDAPQREVLASSRCALSPEPSSLCPRPLDAGGGRVRARRIPRPRPRRQSMATEAEARTACIPCHAFPPPDVLPRAAWRDEIARMSLIRSNLPQPSGPMGTSARMIVLPPDFARVLRYYEANAPETTAGADAAGRRRTADVRQAADEPGQRARPPAISNVRLLDVDGDGRLEVLATDMRFGLVMMGRPCRTRTPRWTSSRSCRTPRTSRWSISIATA